MPSILSGGAGFEKKRQVDRDKNGPARDFQGWNGVATLR